VRIYEEKEDEEEGEGGKQAGIWCGLGMEISTCLAAFSRIRTFLS